MSLNKSIIQIRVDLQNRSLRKSGKNKFAGFEYFELGDFLPTLNELMLANEVNDRFSVSAEYAELTLIKDEERQTYTIPFTQFHTPTNKQGTPSMQDVQYLGALLTYYKRYLYMNAFGITDGEVVDAMEMPTQSIATQDQVLQIQELITGTGTELTEFLKYFRVNAIKDLTSANAANAIKTLLAKKGKMNG